MIRVKDQNGKELELSVYGRYEDDVQIDEIYYTESDDEVPESVINYIADRYAEEINEEWYMCRVEAAEAYADMEEER